MNPRDRIASHLRRILVAAGMALPQPGHADTTTPKPPGKPDDGKTKKPEGKKKEPEHLGYEVVDMLPEPYIERKDKGTLELRSIPSGASILIDGKDIGKKTPLGGWKLAAGIHAITLKSGKLWQNFTVEIQPDKSHVETRDLRPSPAPEPKK
jgi:hypothetical protein